MEFYFPRCFEIGSIRAIQSNPELFIFIFIGDRHYMRRPVMSICTFIKEPELEVLAFEIQMSVTCKSWIALN